MAEENQKKSSSPKRRKRRPRGKSHRFQFSLQRNLCQRTCPFESPQGAFRYSQANGTPRSTWSDTASQQFAGRYPRVVLSPLC